MRYDPLDYLYASARIRAMENRLFGREKLNQLLTAPTVRDIEKALEEWGADKAHEYGLREAFASVLESLPDKALLLFLQYPYDCHNLKTIEKCRIKGVDPAPLLIDLGSVSAQKLLTVSEKELLSLLPAHLSCGVEQARERFAKTGDPKEIDFALDCAAYADMAQAAAPYPIAAELVRVQAERMNLLMCLRLLRMQSGELGRTSLLHAALPVGGFDASLLLSCFDGGEEELYKQITLGDSYDLVCPSEYMIMKMMEGH